MVCSSGGHLDQLLAILPEPEGCDVVFATFLKPDSIGKLTKYKTYGLKWPTNRSIVKTIQNGVIAIKVMLRERPQLIISSGAAAAVPFFYIGKLMLGSRNVYVECIDRIQLPTLTAKLIRPVTDRFICQWETQLEGYPRRVVLGRSR